MSFKTFLENASAGSIGAGSIAANPSGDSRRREHKRAEADWRNSRSHENSEEKKYAHMRDQIAKAKAKKAAENKKKRSFKSWLFGENVNEDFDMNDIVSRLKNSEMETTGADTGVVSYGVEDDKGNVMRITVRADQAKEFEETIALQLADNKENKKNGINIKGNSLAEILFNLRDRFDIVSVDFPVIPKDVVYNADMATKAPEGAFQDDDGGEFSDSFDNFSDGMGDDQDMGDENFDMEEPSTDEGGTSDGMEMSADELGSPDETNPDEMEGDNVEDFSEEPEVEDEGSILKQIVSMLKAQAAAEEAKAVASAEESRAKQAEWSAMAAEKEVKRQEDFARVEAEIQAQKKKEKQAKKYAELARYNVGKVNSSMSMGEGVEPFSFLKAALLTEDEFDSAQALEKQKLQLAQKYRIESTDDNETKNFKSSMYRAVLAELNARIKAAKLNAQFNKNKQEKDQQPQKPQPPQQQQNQNAVPDNNGIE